MYPVENSNEGYDVAQVCLNGHVINSSTQSFPQFSKPHCPDCGQPTIMQCAGCKGPIQGDYHGAGVSAAEIDAPRFCHQCGAAYPWTAKRLRAAQELAEELEGLTEEEKELLKKSIDDLIRDSPSAQLSATRFKRLIAKAKGIGAGALRDMVIDIITESARKILLGG